MKIRSHPFSLIVTESLLEILCIRAVFAHSCYDACNILGVNPVKRLKWRLRWL